MASVPVNEDHEPARGSGSSNSDSMPSPPSLTNPLSIFPKIQNALKTKNPTKIFLTILFGAIVLAFTIVSWLHSEAPTKIEISISTNSSN